MTRDEQLQALAAIRADISALIERAMTREEQFQALAAIRADISALSRGVMELYGQAAELRKTLEHEDASVEIDVSEFISDDEEQADE